MKKTFPYSAHPFLFGCTIFLMCSYLFSNCTRNQPAYGVAMPVIDTINTDATVNLYAFGLVGNGVEDDATAWEKALTYALSTRAKSCIVKAPNCVSRITRPIVIGGAFIDIEKLFSRVIIDSQSKTSLIEYLKGTTAANVKIIGQGRSCIYADFNDTAKMKAVFFLGGMQGRSAPSFLQYNIEISNLGIYAQGYFLNGKVNPNKVDYSKNNVAAIVSAFNNGVTLERITIYGFKEAQIHNQDYFFEASKIVAWYCRRASFDIGCHQGSYISARNYYCDKGLEVRSNKILIDRPYSLGCRVGLHIAGSNNQINGAYLESGLATDGQLTIGDDPGDPGAYKGTIDGLLFNDLTIAGSYPTRVGILFKSNVRTVKISGGALQSMYFKYNNPLTRVIPENVLGNLPPAITIKPTFLDFTNKQVIQ